MHRNPSFLLRISVVLGLAAALAGCPAVYPEVSTPLRAAVEGQALVPAPPPELRFLTFRRASIPALTRDGQRWGSELSPSLPDPYAKLLLNGVEILRTTVQRSTLAPTWPGAPGGNFRIGPDDKLRIELWDARVINDHPIGIRNMGKLDSDVDALPELDVECESGARVVLGIEPAHGFIGYGLNYELRTYDAYVTKVLAESPAARGGILVGDRLEALDAKPVRTMDPLQLKNEFAVPRKDAMAVAVRHEDGSQVHVQLKLGAVYPLYSEYGAMK